MVIERAKPVWPVMTSSPASYPDRNDSIAAQPASDPGKEVKQPPVGSPPQRPRVRTLRVRPVRQSDARARERTASHCIETDLPDGSRSRLRAVPRWPACKL